MVRLKKKLLFIVYVLVLGGILGIFTGCNKPSAPQIDLTKVKPVMSKSSTSEKPLKVAISSITSPSYSRTYYEDLLNYLSRHLHRPVQILQRRSYAEANDLLRAGGVDVAFICTYSYVAGHEEFGLELLAAPQIDGKVTYRAYVIARSDSDIRNFDALRDRRFAFTDPMSTTGNL
ncbi:MAG: PhnD/SsuA/transferrin family substrate-binding protein, partial [Thermanaeromonas sp.]|uniref:PhnD/SsuA/transferrin family substrate-binding protein n=1 Tax=Thermanaeromonas sp. TaxID=2003697 RepID=UPI002437B8BB